MFVSYVSSSRVTCSAMTKFVGREGRAEINTASGAELQELVNGSREPVGAACLVEMQLGTGLGHSEGELDSN